MSAIPPPLARRLDRLARGAHAFHRFAHHPLCAPYAGEVLRLGRRTRLCRGCALVAAGALLGALAALAAPLPGAAALAAAAAPAAALAALLLLAPVRPPAAARRRPSKLATRLAPSAAAAALGTLGARALLGGPAHAPGLAAALAALLLLGAAWLRYRRRGPDRAACRSCPEREGPGACSGFRPIARREAAYRRRAGRLLGPLQRPYGEGGGDGSAGISPIRPARKSPIASRISSSVFMTKGP